VELSANPSTIEQGELTTTIVVHATDPDESDPKPIVTILFSESGTFEDPLADETTFTCGPFAEGPVEVCVEARFADGEDDVDAGAASVVDAGIGAANAYLRAPHAYIVNPEDCRVTECIRVECPENICPVIEEFRLVETPVLNEATVFVTATDPDDRPLDVVTTLSATSGSFDDVNSEEATYMCSSFGEEVIEICVTASDGEAECDQTKCGDIHCNLCPALYSLAAIPTVIPPGQSSATIHARAEDVDNFPEPFTTTLRASNGTFDDVNAFDTVYRCDGAGEVEICVDASDGDCTKTTCLMVSCP
jgi:hypothetical protein